MAHIKQQENKGVLKPAVEKEILKRRQFAGIWNDAVSYPAKYDLVRALGAKNFDSLQKRARRYTKFRLKYPEYGLTELIWRQAITGGMIATPEGVIRQLDEFRVETKVLEALVRGTTKGFVLTGYQFSASLNQWFWKSLKHYEKARGLPLLVLPIKYGAVKTVFQKETGNRILTSTFPDELKGHMLFENLRLFGDELEINVMRMRPTLETFLTPSVCQRGGMRSQIFAAPKLELKHQMRIGRHQPKAVMTTGAVSHPNYSVDNLGQQDRTGEVAAQEHEFAAIVVEFGRKGFHFRQLLANKRGEFYDLNVQKGGADLFTPHGVEHCPDDVNALYCGDYHIGVTDPLVEENTFHKNGVVDRLKPKHIVLGDDIDGWSINHYDEERQGARAAYKARHGFNSLQLELEMAVAKEKWIYAQVTSFVPKAQIHRIAANHPEFVTEYIEQRKWALRGHDINAEIGAEMFLAMRRSMPKPKVELLKSGRFATKFLTPKELDVRPIDPVVWYFRVNCPEIISYERQDKLFLPKGVKHPILCSLHGDKSSRGWPTRSTKEFRNVGRRTMLGHNHSGEINGIAWRVGTSTGRTQHYVMFPDTAWSQTHGIIYKNGQRQLLNFVQGEWYGKNWDL